MARREDEIAKKERESLAAFRKAEEHRATVAKERDEPFAKADKLAIAKAAELVPLERAGSPLMAEARRQLEVLMGVRDAISYTWNREQELLEADVEAFTAPVILEFGQWSLTAKNYLRSKTQVTYRDHMVSISGDRRNVECQSNEPSVQAALETLEAGVARVKALHLHPLAEVHDAINAVVAQYRNDIEGLTMQEMTIAGSEFRRLQSLSADMKFELGGRPLQPIMEPISRRL